MNKDKKPKKQDGKGINEKSIVDFTMGAREPVTEEEKRLKADIDEIKREGLIVDIPFDI